MVTEIIYWSAVSKLVNELKYDIAVFTLKSILTFEKILLKRAIHNFTQSSIFILIVAHRLILIYVINIDCIRLIGVQDYESV